MSLSCFCFQYLFDTKIHTHAHLCVSRILKHHQYCSAFYIVPVQILQCVSIIVLQFSSCQSNGQSFLTNSQEHGGSQAWKRGEIKNVQWRGLRLIIIFSSYKRFVGSQPLRTLIPRRDNLPPTPNPCAPCSSAQGGDCAAALTSIQS